jgi:hypothetical protein
MMKTRFNVGDVVYFRFGAEVHEGRIRKITIAHDVYYSVANFNLLTEGDLHASEQEIMNVIRKNIIIHEDNEGED